MISQRDTLIALSLIHRGDIRAIYRTMRNQTGLDFELGMRLKAKLTCPYVVYGDPDYPIALTHIPMPPVVLYYQGDISLVQNSLTCVSIVGAREASAYGLKHAKNLAGGLAAHGLSIVSGLARGIDTAALEMALPHHKAVAVLGNGFHYVYPEENRSLQRDIKRNGLLLSEYPPNVPPSQFQFPARNRIIAGLSQVTLVAQAGIRSGSLITATFALNNGKDVGAIPYPIAEKEEEASGCNALIRDGAYIVEGVEDVAGILRLKGLEILQNDYK